MTAAEFRCWSCSAEKYKQETVPSVRKAIAVGVVVLTLAAASSCGNASHTAQRDSGQATPAAVAVPASTPAPDSPPAPASSAPDAAPPPEFATVSKLMNDAIAASTVPGGVVVVGHAGKVVFHQAYGSRKRAGEPGLDGSPAPAEPMTEDTIFDMASLTKCLATATAGMQLYEQGKVANLFELVDAPDAADVHLLTMKWQHYGDTGRVEQALRAVEVARRA